jgi:adenine-specific DNA-methyltransferase
LILSQIATRVRGYDLDPFGAWLAQTAAHFAVRDIEAAAGRRLATIVHTRDSLEVRPEDRDAFDLVASNVPFGRITLPPERRAIYARSTYGHANLYGLFTDAGLHYAGSHGVVAYVMPTSMLSGLYFQSLRALLAKEAPPHELTFVTARSGVFDDALQETMLATYCKGRPAESGTVHFLTMDDKGQANLTDAGHFLLPSVQTAPWILPRTADRADLAARLPAMKFRLSNYGYTVSTGPLVWNRHKPQFRVRPEPGCVPVVWAEAVTSDGRFICRADKRGHAPWFMPENDKDNWLIVRQACVLLQRTTAKEQDRRLIAAEMPADFVASHRGGVTVENHLNMVRSRAERPAVPPGVVATVLNSRAADAAFRCISGSVAVSAFELEALPLPAPATMRKIATLLERRASATEIEQAIAAAYGMSDVSAAA